MTNLEQMVSELAADMPITRDRVLTLSRRVRLAALEDALAVAETTTSVMRARDAIRAMIEREQADG